MPSSSLPHGNMPSHCVCVQCMAGLAVVAFAAAVDPHSRHTAQLFGHTEAKTKPSQPLNTHNIHTQNERSYF